MVSTTPATGRHFALALTLVLVAGFALRLAFAMVLPDQSAALGDVLAYQVAGRSLWATGQMGTPYHMPLYPALVAATGPGWIQQLIDIGLSTAIIWLVYQLAYLIFADKRVALLAGAATAVYPYLIFYAVVGLTETLFIALVLAAYVCWYRDLNAAAAVFAVLAILTRPSFDPIAPILLLYFALVVHRHSIATAIRNLAVYGVIYCAMMAPWWLHNYQAYGTFVRLNLGGGLALLSGNNPHNRTGGIDMQLGTSTVEFSGISNPVMRDRAMLDAAVANIKSDPQRFLSQAILKFERFWRPWPYTEFYQGRVYLLVSLLSFLPVLIMAMAFLVLRGYSQLRQIAPLLLFVGYLTAVHMVFPGSIRYRLPLEPLLIILAAAGVVDLVSRWRLIGARP